MNLTVHGFAQGRLYKEEETCLPAGRNPLLLIF